jgi:16S rRNA (guanine527-N7)-methyltransferase
MKKDGVSREELETAVFSLLESGLTELSTPVEKSQVSQLVDLVSLLSQWADRINLTAHRDPIEMTSRLVMDAAALSSTLFELGSASTLVDLGSGAGFPGLPIAILRPSLEIVLVESRLKRHHFQREACRRLGLPHVRPTLGRSDEIEIRPADIVVAQAMTQPARAFELMLPWCRPGGLVVLPASEGAEQPALPATVRDCSLREYIVPGTGRVRCLWIAKVEPS